MAAASPSKEPAVRSQFLEYPGCKGPIKETFFIRNKQSFQQGFFCLIADCLPLSELIPTTGYVNRQFKSMTYKYINDQIPKIRSVLEFFIAHFSDDKLKQQYPKALEKLEQTLTELNRDTPQLAFQLNQRYEPSLFKIVNRCLSILSNIPNTLSNVKEADFPPYVVRHFNEKNLKAESPKFSLPNSFKIVVIKIANYINIQPNVPFSNDVSRWAIDSFSMGTDQIDSLHQKSEGTFILAGVRNPILRALKVYCAAKVTDGHIPYLNYYTFNFHEMNVAEAQISDVALQQIIGYNAYAIALAEKGQFDKALAIGITFGVANEPNRFFCTDKLVLAIVKSAISANRMDFAIRTLDYYIKEKKGVDCSEPIKMIGKLHMENGEIQKAMELCYKYQDHGNHELVLAYEIIKFFVNRKLNKEFINFIQNYPNINKRSPLLIFLCRYLLSLNEVQNVEEIVFNDTTREYCKDDILYCELANYYIEKGDLASLHKLKDIVLNYHRRNRVMMKIVQHLLLYQQPLEAIKLISSFNPKQFEVDKNSLDQIDCIWSLLVHYYLQKRDYDSANSILERSKNRISVSHYGSQFYTLNILFNHFIQINEQADAIQIGLRMLKQITFVTLEIPPLLEKFYRQMIDLYLKVGEKKQALEIVARLPLKEQQVEREKIELP